ncbi:MAG: IclR family transcriptional regulator [Thermaerobacter sp.]|nr:IclR family transcriptional regulator [Thermaerobacter sp.]
MERLDRFVKVLDFIARHGRQGVSLAQVGYAIELPKASLYRLINDLEQAELIIHDTKTNRYYLGWQVFTWAALFLNQSNFVELINDAVAQITARCQLFAYGAIFTRGQVITVATASPRAFYPVYVKLGTSVPLRAAAVSKIFLSMLDPEIAQRFLQNEELEPGFWSPTPHTLTVDQALGELAEIRRQGWAACRNELEMGNSAVAVPVGPLEKTWVSLAVVAPTEIIANREREILDTLRDVAQSVEGPLELAQAIDG